MSAGISLRLAKEQDFEDVLEVSEGIYDGRDYLPFLYHRWLKLSNKYVFVAELQGKMIGLMVATVIDGDQTLFSQSIRIHQEYRGRGYIYDIIAGVIERVRGSHPRISQVRHMIDENDSRMKRISEKLGYKAVMKRNNCRFESFALNPDVFRKFNTESDKNLHEIEGKDAEEFILTQRRFDDLIPNQTLVIFAEPFELMQENVGLVFMDDDKMFTDVSVEELRQNVMPRSFSHGRMIAFVDVQCWKCNIYANDSDEFKAQLVRQTMSAIEQLKNAGRKSELEVLFSKDLIFDVQEIFEAVLGLEQSASVVHHDIVLYEKTF